MGEGNKTLEEINKGDSDSKRKSDKSHRESVTTETETGTKTEVDGSTSISEEGEGKGRKGKLDIDATINEASDLAEQTEHQRNKEQAAQRKGESVEGEGVGRSDGRGLGSRERMEREKAGRERGKRIVGKNQERFE